MKTQLTVLLITAALANNAYSAPAPYKIPQKPFIVAGVDIRAVGWEKLCPSVKPIVLTRAGVTCKTVHPASGAVAVWRDWGNTGQPDPGPNCAYEAGLFARLTQPGDASDPWGGCEVNFTRALKDRAGTRIEYRDMSLEQFRDKYFPASVYKAKTGE